MKKRTTLVSLLVLLVACTSAPSPQVVEESTRKQSQSISLILKKTLLTQSRITLIYLNSDDENIYSEVH